MILDALIFGAISTLISATTVYYNYRIVKKFSENSKLAATKLVLKDEVRSAYSILAFTAMIFSTLTVAGAYALGIEGFDNFQYLSEIGGIIFMIGLLAFHRKISFAVEVEEDEED